ncbi:MAG: helix-turn-helix domain-containing protein [Patescibacteria group bacterium]|nr:hypothetical protein [Patescibacteria group bacterium]
MPEHIIKNSKRFASRRHGKALRDIYKIFTELITNSDESYNRLEKKGINIDYIKSIEIYIDRRTRVIRVIDYAEGMNQKDIEENFGKYGAIKSGSKKGHDGRGLYGQGLTDVLFLNPSSTSNLYSIKDDELYICSFYYKEDDQIYSHNRLSKKELKKYRQKYNIKKNGTVIEFELPSFKKINLPEFQNLFRGLSDSYMLRFINSNPDRNITLIETENKKNPVSKKIEYKFVEKLYSNDVSKILDKKLYFKPYEEFKPVEIDICLYKAKFDLVQKIGENANKILVYDANYDNSVYDLDFFGFEKNLGANNIFGYIKLTNAREIIDEKLNEEIPEEILTDTRNGFDKSQLFYKYFSNKVKDLLYPIFDEFKNSEEDASDLSEETKKRHSEVFKKLNKIYSDLVGEKSGGTFDNPDSRKINELMFARENIKITVDKQYYLQLKINIDDFSQNAKVFLLCNEKQISVTPDTIILKKEDANRDGIISKHIKIKSNTLNAVGKITATCEESQAVCFVSVIQSDLFYPQNGIEFYPNELSVVTNRKSKLYLFVDLEKVKTAEVINLESDNSSIILLDKKVKVPKEKISKSNNAMIPIGFIGQKSNENGNVIAISNNYQCNAKIYVHDKNRIPPQGKDAGIFRGWKFRDMPEQIQKARAQFGEEAGFIIINRKNPINKIYFGEDPKMSDVEKSIIMQLYLAELILDEFLNLSVAEAYNNGNLGQKTDDAHTDISGHIIMKKLEIGAIIYEMFVDKPLHQDYINIINRNIETNDANVLVSRIDVLGGRLKEIVEMKFGINENRKHTLEEISLKYKISRERVRQIINSALPKLYGDDEIITINDIPKEESSIFEGKKGKRNIKIIDYIDRFEKSLDVSTDKIIEGVADFYSIKENEIKSISRKKEFAYPRQISMYLIRKHLKSSFPVIGNIFKRDHTTIMYAYKKIQKDYKKDNKMQEEITLIESNLRNLDILA